MDCNDEYLPEDMKDVLLFDKMEGRYIGYYYSSQEKFIRYVDGYSSENVTHWMPLPEPPKIQWFTKDIQVESVIKLSDNQSSSATD